MKKLRLLLSIAVLRLANSAKFGVPGREFNLREATVRLGVRSLSRIVLQQQVSGVLAGDVRAFGLRRGALWRGALAGAFAAEKLASIHAPDVQEQSFVCALLRDIGKLVFFSEVAALRGAGRLLDQRPDLLIEIEPDHLARQGTSANEVVALLRPRGYSFFRARRDSRGQLALAPDEDPTAPGHDTPNVVATADPDRLRRLLTG